MRSKLVLGAALLLALAACHRHRAEDDEAPLDNAAIEAPEPAPAPPVIENTTEAPPKPAKVAAPPPAAALSEDQQMADDADATGLTARVDRNAVDDEPGNDTPTQVPPGNTQ